MKSGIACVLAAAALATLEGGGQHCPAATPTPSTVPAAVDLDRKIVITDDRRRLMIAAYWFRPGPTGGRDKLSADDVAKLDAAQRRIYEKHGLLSAKPTAKQRREIDAELTPDVLALLTPTQVAEANAAVEAGLPTVRLDRQIVSATHLHVIGLGTLLYQQDHQQQYPPDLATLVREEQLPLDALTCPGTGHVPPADWKSMPVDEQVAWAATNCDYTYIRPATTILGPNAVMCYETADDHEGRGTVVLYGDLKGVFVQTAVAKRQIDDAKRAAAR